MMEMRLSLLVKLAGIFVLLTTVNGEISCFPDQKLTPQRECVDCEYCPSGEGVDIEEKVPVNEEGIALECRGCKPCPAGFWNDQIYGQMSCMRCRLDCLALNRKEYEPCGGSSRGQCGACINSDFEDVQQSIESPCVKKPISSTSTNTAKILMAFEIQNRTEELDAGKLMHQPQKGTSDSDDLQIGQTIVLSVAGVLFIALLFISYYLWKHRSRDTKASPELGSSGDTILSKNSSLLGEVNTAHKQDLSKDDDLETDSLLLENEARQITAPVRGPRPELPNSLPSSGPDGMTGKGSYPNILLKTDDDFITLASKHIYDEGKYKPMFRELGVSEQNIHAQYELFYHEKHTYDYMIRCLLNKWVKLAGPGATLDVLCEALDENEFHNVCDKLMFCVGKHH